MANQFVNSRVCGNGTLCYVKILMRKPWHVFWAKFGHEKMMESIRDLFIAQEKDQEEALVTALDNLKLIEEQLKEKKFFNEETIASFDFVFGWMADISSILQKIASQKLVDSDRFPHSSWIQYFLDAPLKECWPPRDKMITKFQAMREKYLTTAAPK